MRGAWAPILVLFSSMVGAETLDLYARYAWIDMPMHFAGGAALAYFFHRCSLGRAACLALTLAGALAWETGEAACDFWLGTRMTHGAGDTLHDLAFGLAGASACLRLSSRPGRPPCAASLPSR